jgi:release factor glutamine methyltransferase
MREVRDFEPEGALVGGRDGLAVLRPLIADAARPGVLAPDGALLLEIGSARQAEAVEALMRQAGFGEVRLRLDYAKLPRVVVGLLGTS